jgi:dUTP pyrophosphatase
MILQYFKHSLDVVDPNFQTRMAACFDLAAYIPKNEKIKIYKGKNFTEILPEYDSSNDKTFIALMPGERALIRTGLTFDIPADYSIRIHPRSGMALKYGLTLANAEGVVDEDYTYETKLIVLNTNQMDSVKIYNGDRIAQAEVVKYEQVKFAEIYNQPGLKTDRVGGFGSTGVR